MTNPKPKFLVNPALSPTMWTPEIWQIANFPNPNYLNSVWLGTVWNVVIFPTRLWHEVIKTAFIDGLGEALVLAGCLAVSTIGMFFGGLFSRCRAIRLPLEVLIDCTLMSVEDATQDIQGGPGVLVRSNQ